MTTTASERSAALHDLGLDGQNQATIGRLLATGNGSGSCPTS
jgi:hypothetical protein